MISYPYLFPFSVGQQITFFSKAHVAAQGFFCLVGTESFFLGEGPGHEVDHSSSSSTDVWNEWS
jgi:hypothetical protein